MKINRLVLMALLSLGLSLFISIPSIAVHKGAGDLVCGNCHTMHSSQGGTNGMSMGGASGSFILLRSGNSSINSRAEIHKLCLQCHGDGSNATQKDVVHAPQNVVAPKVYSSGSWNYTVDAFNKIGAGGNFYNELDGDWNPIDTTYLGKGHSIGAGPGIIPPGGDQPIGGEGFSCTNCHDPHGANSDADTKTNVFRNLKIYATGAGNKEGVKFYTFDNTSYYRMKSYVGGVNPSGTSGYFGGSETDNAGNVIWPVYRNGLSGTPANDSNDSNSYATGFDDCLNCASGDNRVTMSRWCAQCHDKWHEDIETTNRKGTGDEGYLFPRVWWRHNVNAVIPTRAYAGCALNCHRSMLDRTTYTTPLISSGKAIPVTAAYLNATEELVYYLPHRSGSAPWDCTGVEGTCMDNNGSSTQTVPNHKVFCLTCHFAHGGPYYDNLRWDYTSAVSSGSQSGNGVPSNVGCQLCHNR